MKRLWQRLHGLLAEEQRGQTSTHTADGFAAFFFSKVDKVHTSTASTPPYNMPFRTTPTVDQWTHVAIELHPVPTCMVKDIRGLLAPLVTVMLDESLAASCFPNIFKHAVVRPLVKRSRLDASDL